MLDLQLPHRRGVRGPAGREPLALDGLPGLPGLARVHRDGSNDTLDTEDDGRGVRPYSMSDPRIKLRSLAANGRVATSLRRAVRFSVKPEKKYSDIEN